MLHTEHIKTDYEQTDNQTKNLPTPHNNKDKK